MAKPIITILSGPVYPVIGLSAHDLLQAGFKPGDQIEIRPYVVNEPTRYVECSVRSCLGILPCSDCRRA